MGSPRRRICGGGRRRTVASSLRYEWAWTGWTAAVVVTFLAPAIVLVALEPLLAPVAAICLAHAWLIPGSVGAARVAAGGADRQRAQRGAHGQVDPGG